MKNQYSIMKYKTVTWFKHKKVRLLAHVWDPYSLSLMSWLIE